jgi:hypothetical protein
VATINHRFFANFPSPATLCISEGLAFLSLSSAGIKHFTPASERFCKLFSSSQPPHRSRLVASSSS